MSYEIVQPGQLHRPCRYPGCSAEAIIGSDACAKHGLAYDAIRRREDNRKQSKREKIRREVRAQMRAQLAAKYADEAKQENRRDY
jgi:hypothetical protein